MNARENFTYEDYNYSQSWNNLNKTNKAEQETFSEWVLWLSFSIALLSTILGAAANGTTIVAYRQNKKLRFFNHLVCNLCVIELIFTILIIPSFLPLIVTQSHGRYLRLCQIVVYLHHAMTLAMVVNLISIAINRYVAIVHSLKYSRIYSGKKLKCWIASSWIIPPFLFLPFAIHGLKDSTCEIVIQTHQPFWKVLKILLLTALYLCTTVVMIVLYRKVFIKAKKSRKNMEHHPGPVSCTPSNLDQDLHGSARMRTFRRQSSSKVRRTDSQITQKASESGKTMSYLQVPISPPPGATDIKQENILFKHEKPEHPIAASLKLFREHEAQFEWTIQSTPDLHMRLAVNDRAHQNEETWNDELSTKLYHNQPLTSERPKIRLQDLKKLHILSTIESESHSKSENAEFYELDFTLEKEGRENGEPIDNNCTLVGNNMEPHWHNSEQYFIFLKESPKLFDADSIKHSNRSESSNSSIYSHSKEMTLSQQNLKKEYSEGENSKMKQLTDIEILSRHVKKEHSMSCTDILVSSNLNRKSLDESEIRRHSISTCSECRKNLFNNKFTRATKMEKRNRKTLSWKRKNFFVSKCDKTALSSKFDNFSQKFKTNKSRFSLKTIKKQSLKKSNTTGIKIVIDHATSEDAQDVKFWPEAENQKLKDNFEKKKAIVLKDKKKKCNTHQKHNFHKEQETNETQWKAFDVLELNKHRLEKLTSQSVESLPSQLPSQQGNRLQIAQNSKQQNKARVLLCEDSLLEPNQHLNVAVQRESFNYTRCSSVISNNNRHDVAEEHSSYSHVNYDDAHRRRNDHSPTQSRQNSISKKKSTDRPRKRSLYVSLQQRKSIFSSLTSGVSTESRFQRRRRDAERQIACNAAIFCMGFAFIVLPSYVVETVSALTSQSINCDVQLLIATLSWLHVIVNPALYGYMNPQFRRTYKQMYEKIKRRWNVQDDGKIREPMHQGVSRQASYLSINPPSRI